MGTRALGVETFDPAGTLPAAAGVFCPLEGQCPEGGGVGDPAPGWTPLGLSFLLLSLEARAPVDLGLGVRWGVHVRLQLPG